MSSVIRVEMPCLWGFSLEIGVLCVLGMDIICIAETDGVGPDPSMNPTVLGTGPHALFQVLASILNAIIKIYYT
jgi:hypothetical protein